MASNADDSRRNAQPGSRDGADLVRLPRIGHQKAGFDAPAREEKAAANQAEPERMSLVRLRPKKVGDAEGSARQRITERAEIVPQQPASDGCVQEEVRINKRKADLVKVIHVSDDETVVEVPPTKIKKKKAAGDSRVRGRGSGRGRGRGRGSAAKSAVAASSSQGNRCWLIAPSSPVPNRRLFTAPPASPVADDAGHLQVKSSSQKEAESDGTLGPDEVDETELYDAGHLQVETSSQKEAESDGTLGPDGVDETELYLLASVAEMVANDSDSATRNNYANGEGTSQEVSARNCTGGELPGDRDN